MAVNEINGRKFHGDRRINFPGRKMAWAFRLALLILAFSVPGLVLAHTHGVALAVETDKAPVIDGSLTGWNAPFIHLSTQTPDWFMGKSRIYGKPVKSPKSLEAWYSLQWKGDQLYLAAFVLADTITKNHNPDLGQAWNSSSVEVYLALNHDAPYFSSGRQAPYREGDFQIRLVPFEKEPGVHGGAYLGTHGADVSEDQFHQAVKFTSKPFTYSGRKGYIVEASINTAGLGFPDWLKNGKVVGFDFIVNDADSSKGRDRILSWSSFDNRAYNDSSCFGDLVLAGPQGDFTPAEGSASSEKEGYYLVPGRPLFQTPLQAMGAPQGDDAQGKVVYSSAPPAKAQNISGLFDPKPFRPIYKSEIRYCQVGYLPDGKKVAYLEVPAGDPPPADRFSLTQSGKEVFSAVLKKWGTLWMRDYYLLDFNSFTGTGQGYALGVGDAKTVPFPIAPGVYDASVSMALHGVFVAEKCGVEAMPFHHACHKEDAIQAGPDDVRSGQKVLQFPPVFKPGTHVDVSGGWHDAGDFGKYMGNAPHALELFLLNEDEFHPNLERDASGKDALVREAEYTADWCMKMQDKDGGVFERVWSGFTYSGPPEGETTPRLLDSDKWANVTARWVAAAALGAQSLLKADPPYAEKLKKSALKGWEFVENCPSQPEQPWAYGVYPGNDSCFFWAAVELYRLTKEDKYLQSALKRLSGMLATAPQFLGWTGNNTIALIRLYPVLPEGPEKNQVKEWLLNRVKTLDQGEAKNPFGIDYAAQSGWGNDGDLVARAMERYFIREILPGSGGLDSLESYRQWIYGANPAGYCFVVGRGDKQVRHEASSMGKNMPGALVPGIVDDGTGLPFYTDSRTSYVTNEAGPDPSVFFINYAQAPWKKETTAQDPAQEQAERERALAKPVKPDVSMVVDFNSISPDAIWTGGGKGGTLKKSFVKTVPGGGLAFRGDFTVGEWTTSVAPATGNLASATGLAFQARGNGCKLRFAIDDANAEDWGSEVTVAPDWKPVTLYFTDLVQPPWTVQKDTKPLDLAGIQKFKVQPEAPDSGWFEVSNVHRVDSSPSAQPHRAAGLLGLSQGDNLWTTGDGDFDINKSVEDGPSLHVKFKVGKWCMAGLSGNFMPGRAKGIHFRAKGAGVALRIAVGDAQNHEFGQAVHLTGDWADVTVLFSGMTRSEGETQDKTATLDTAGFNQIKVQPLAPATGEFWITDLEWEK